MRSVVQFVVVLVVIGSSGLFLMDQIIMPWYTQQESVKYLPNVVGMDYVAAEERLEVEGFRVEQAGIKYTNEYAPDQVYEMYPAPYSRVKAGRIISLTVTDVEKMAFVPDLVGKTLRTADIEASQMGFMIDTVLYEYSEEFGSQTVTWQSPKGGNLLRRGSGLALMVSLGKPPDVYYVPSVIGYSLKNGRREILDAGLEIGTIKYVYSTNLVPNTILDQSIPGGTVLSLRRQVNLTVSSSEKEP